MFYAPPTPSPGAYKFSFDGAARGKPWPIEIGGMLRNSKGGVLFIFSKHVGICNSNEAEFWMLFNAL